MSKQQPARYVYSPNLNPFFSKRKPSDEESYPFPITTGYLPMPRDAIMQNLEMMRTDSTLMIARENKLRSMNMCPINIAIGEKVLVEVCETESSAISMRWLEGQEHYEMYKEAIEETVQIIQISRNPFTRNCFDSKMSSGVVVVQPSVKDEMFQKKVPLARLWSDTDAYVKLVNSQHVYRVFERPDFMAKKNLQDLELYDAVVFQMFNYAPLMFGTKALIFSPLQTLRTDEQFRSAIRNSERIAAMHNATPGLVVEPLDERKQDLQQTPVTSLVFADRVVTIDENEAATALRQERENQRVNEHNRAQAEESTLSREVAGPNGATSLSMTQYKVPLGYRSGKPISVNTGRNDITKVQEVYENQAASAMGDLRSVMYGDFGSKTNANTGLLQRILSENIQEFAATVGYIYTYAINVILTDLKLRNRATKIKNPEKIDPVQAGKEDFIHITFQFHKYDQDDLDKLYSRKMIDYGDWSRRTLQFYGITNGVQESAKDKFDDEVKEDMLLNRTSSKRKDSDEAKTGKATKKAKKTGE